MTCYEMGPAVRIGDRVVLTYGESSVSPWNRPWYDVVEIDDGLIEGYVLKCDPSTDAADTFSSRVVCR